MILCLCPGVCGGRGGKGGHSIKPFSKRHIPNSQRGCSRAWGLLEGWGWLVFGAVSLSYREGYLGTTLSSTYTANHLLVTKAHSHISGVREGAVTLGSLEPSPSSLGPNITDNQESVFRLCLPPPCPPLTPLHPRALGGHLSQFQYFSEICRVLT